MKTRFLATVKQGKISFGSENNRDRFLEWSKGIEGKKIRIELADEKKRTLTQNNYYWLYMGIVEADTGNLADDLHEYFKRKFLPPRFVKVMDDEIKIPASTTKLDKIEFGDYLDKICALTNVPLPDPQEAGYLPR